MNRAPAQSLKRKTPDPALVALVRALAIEAARADYEASRNRPGRVDERFDDDKIQKRRK